MTKQTILTLWTTAEYTSHAKSPVIQAQAGTGIIYRDNHNAVRSKRYEITYEEEQEAGRRECACVKCKNRIHGAFQGNTIL